MKSILPVATLILGFLMISVPVLAQEQKGRLGVQGQPGEGKVIRAVIVDGWPQKRRRAFLDYLSTKEGGKLSSQKVRGDLEKLWRRFKVRCDFNVADLPDDPEGVVLKIQVHGFPTYRKITFRGMKAYEEDWARDYMGIKKDAAPTALTADYQARVLRDYYKKKGYYFAKIDIRTDEKKGILTFVVDEGPLVKVRDVRFIGNKTFVGDSAFGLRKSVLGGSGMKSTPGFFSNSIYNLEQLDGDLDKLRAFYRGEGYRDALVELQDLEFTPERSGVKVTIRIKEGKRYKIESVRVRIIPSAIRKEDQFTPEMLEKELDLRPGDYATSIAIQQDKMRLAAFYGSRGYPDGATFRELPPDTTFRVLEPEEIVDPENGTVALTFVLQEGTKKRVHSIRIHGNDKTRDYVIRRDVSLLPGEMLDMQQFRRTQSRLDGLGYFGNPAAGQRGLTMRLLPHADSDEYVDIDLEVVEGRTGSLIFGAGLSSSDGLIGNITYRKKNFDWTRPPTGWNPFNWIGQIVDNDAFHGGGQELVMEVAPGTRQSTANVLFREPDLFGTYVNRVSMSANLYRAIRIFRSYEQDGRGLGLNFGKNFGRDMTASLGFRLERMDIRNIAPDATSVTWDAEGKNDLLSLQAGWRWKDVDKFVAPTKGYKLSLGGEWGPEGLGDRWVQYWTARASGDWYLPVFTDDRNRRHVLHFESRFDVGRSLNSDEPDLFLTKRFFMGGQNTMRGFDFRGAGPTQFGSPFGGELRLLGSAEYIFPIISTDEESRLLRRDLLRGVLFVDAGMLGNRVNGPFFRQVRVSTGFGLRILLPMMGGLPLALDFGWPLRRESSDRLQAFHFALTF